MQQKRLYKVAIGLLDKDGDVISNWASKNVIAVDAKAAISKARLGPRQFAEQVTILGTVDVV